MDSETSKFNQFEKAGIPVLYNADWVETTPLGKAEWIKFFGVLFDQQEEANEYSQNRRFFFYFRYQFFSVVIFGYNFLEILFGFFMLFNFVGVLFDQEVEANEYFKK